GTLVLQRYFLLPFSTALRLPISPPPVSVVRRSEWIESRTLSRNGESRGDADSQSLPDDPPSRGSSNSPIRSHALTLRPLMNHRARCIAGAKAVARAAIPIAFSQRLQRATTESVQRPQTAETIHHKS